MVAGVVAVLGVVGVVVVTTTAVVLGMVVGVVVVLGVGVVVVTTTAVVLSGVVGVVTSFCVVLVLHLQNPAALGSTDCSIAVDGPLLNLSCLVANACGLM